MGKYKHYADVIVVGAGFAGLRAAQLLRQAGLTVIVLESRVRIGGRCQTGVFLGEHFDVGGHWIGAHQVEKIGWLYGIEKESDHFASRDHLFRKSSSPLLR